MNYKGMTVDPSSSKDNQPDRAKKLLHDLLVAWATTDWTLTLKRNDIEAWNQFRQKAPDDIPNLSGEDFANLDWSGANLAGVNLKDANLSRTNLTGTDLTKADLSGANLTEANLTGAILHATNLQSAHLTKSILTGVQLEHCLMNDETDLTDCLCDYICIGQEKIDILKKEDLELLKGDLEDLRTMSKNRKNTIPENQDLVSGRDDPLREEIEIHLGRPTKNNNILEEVRYLQARLQSYTYQKKLIAVAEKPSLGAYIKKTAPYAAAVLAFLLFGGFLYGYKKDQVQVSFTYDVGTITGGVLVGTAALMAATAYLKKSTEESNERSDRNLQ